MKQLLPLLLLFSLHGRASAQLYLAGGTLKISPGAVLHSTGNVTNTGGGSLTNDGTLSTPGSIANSAAATLQGNGQYTLSGNWTNSANFAAGTSTVTFSGASNSTATPGGDAFHEVEMAKTDADLLLAGYMGIDDTLHFTSVNNQVILGPDTLSFSSAGGITGHGSDKFIVTNGSGEVRKVALGTVAFTFPVGYAESTYTPLTLVQSASGTVDGFGVRALEHVLEDGTTGTALTEGVADASWLVSEAVAGGSDLTLTAQWAAGDELPGFDRSDSGISRYGLNGWDMLNAHLGNAAGSDPYTRMRGGIGETGVFAVGGETLLHRLEVELKAYLQGPFSGGQMGDALRSQSLLPTTEPYTALSGFTHVGRGGGETVDPSVFAATGSDAVVDWVFLELRDATAPGTVLETRSALIQRDGDIVDVDGNMPVIFLGTAGGNYHLAVRHRNHLGVRTAGTLALPLAAPPYDFTASLGQATGSNPMAALSGGAYGLWAGDVNLDQKVRYSDLFIPPFTFIPSDAIIVFNALGGDPSGQLNAYSSYDVNMDGKVRYSDLFIPPFTFIPSDAIIIFNVLGGDPSAQASQGF